MRASPLDESIAAAVATSGTAIVFAGTTVVIALITLVVAGIPLVTSLGYAAAFAVMTAVLPSITLLPAVLAVVGTRLESLRLPAFIRPRPKAPERGFWGWWARQVTAHPWLAVAAAAAILAPLIVPFLSLDLGQEDIGATPKSTTERQAYDLMAAGFGVGYNGPLLVAAEVDPQAKPSSEFESQKKQAQDLQKQLEQEQTQGQSEQQQLTQQANELTRQQDELEQQQQALEQQQGTLEQEQASLEQQAKELSEEQLELQATQGSAPGAAGEPDDPAERARERRRRSWCARARGWRRSVRPSSRRLARTRADERAVEARLRRDPPPPEQVAARGEAAKPGATRRSASARARARDPAGTGASDAVAGARRDLAEPARRRRPTWPTRPGRSAPMPWRSPSRRRRSCSEKQTLVEQAADLQVQAANLQVQAADLQTQAANLQTQKVELQGQQQQAQSQQQQAEQLQTDAHERTDQGRGRRAREPTRASSSSRTASRPRSESRSSRRRGSTRPATLWSSRSLPPPLLLRPRRPTWSRTLRTYTIPQATSGTSVDALVGGQTASYVDLADGISSRLMLVILAVIALSFVVLLTAFRSLVVAAQAAVANVLSVAAAFGVLTAVFQWGWGLSLVGLDTARGTDPIASYVPLMMFAVLFGLSMDYQVFLISQIEHHRAAGEDARAGGGRRTRDGRAGDRRRRADHDVRLRELHPQRRSDREAVRGRALGRRRACRHDRAPARAGAARARRRGKLVDSGLARSRTPAHRHRRRCCPPGSD